MEQKKDKSIGKLEGVFVVKQILPGPRWNNCPTTVKVVGEVTPYQPDQRSSRLDDEPTPMSLIVLAPDGEIPVKMGQQFRVVLMAPRELHGENEEPARAAITARPAITPTVTAAPPAPPPFPPKPPMEKGS